MEEMCVDGGEEVHSQSLKFCKMVWWIVVVDSVSVDGL